VSSHHSCGLISQNEAKPLTTKHDGEEDDDEEDESDDDE
jgi:hypothetical protein